MSARKHHPKFHNPTGEYLLFTSDNYSGQKVRPKNGKVTVVTKALNADNVQISALMEIIFLS